MKKLIVPKKYNNKKLIRFLNENLPNVSNNLIYKTLRKKDIKINGKRVNENIILNEGDEVLIYIPDNYSNSHFSLDIVFEDDNILIINKPSNIEVVGENSLTTILQEKYSNKIPFPAPCHRLDRNTCGLILYAKNEASLKILLEKFRNHEIEKHYLALVYGYPKQSSEVLTSYLFKDSKKSLVYISDNYKKGYSKIVTKYNLIEKYPNNTSLLEVEIKTGKTHQIRAHLAHIGLPIVGDRKIWN